jgi:hypothetical protein
VTTDPPTGVTNELAVKELELGLKLKAVEAVLMLGVAPPAADTKTG